MQLDMTMTELPHSSAEEIICFSKLCEIISGNKVFKFSIRILQESTKNSRLEKITKIGEKRESEI